MIIRNLPSSNLIYEVLKKRPGNCACTAWQMKQNKTEMLQTCATDEGPCKDFTHHHMKENTNGPAVSQTLRLKNCPWSAMGISLKSLVTAVISFKQCAHSLCESRCDF